MIGLWILVAALLVSVVLAVWFRRRNGRFREANADEDVLSAADIGAPLATHATLVQFSSAFCAPCRATRVLLTEVAAGLDGVDAVEVDAESHLDLIRRLDVLRTPTTFVLDARGVIVSRASGLPQRDQVLAVLAAIPGVTEQIVRNVD